MGRRAFSRLFAGQYGGVGTKPAVTGLTVSEEGFGAVKKTVLRLNDVPVPVISVTTGNGVGGVKIYDFPGGDIVLLGCIAQLSNRIVAAEQADFTDATPEGDVGIGTVAPANADALGTDATDDNFGTAAPFTMSAYADASIPINSEAIQVFDGKTTPIDLYLNQLVDAADIDDGATSEILYSGVITVHWLNRGDNG
jgi:hypothetical protein